VTRRVVSLVPSVSETLVAWGVVPVAVTRFCEQPGLATVGGTKNPDIAAIVALDPDVVVVDEEENRREDAEALEAAGVALHVTHVRRVADVAPMLAALRVAVGLRPSARTDGDGAGRGKADVETADGGEADGGKADGGKGAAGGDVPAGGRPGRRVWVPIWRRPWMTINDDTYGGSVLEACGLVNVFGGHPDRYPTVTLDDVAARRPEAVLAPTEPYPWADRHRKLFADIAPMTIVDGKDLFWWGVRTGPGLARLRDRFAPG
jgi:ABC-type Fe3+-hydroxamate transport system substrate-binding protein